MADILKEIIKVLPAGKISDAAYEAANIVLYTKDKDYFLDNKGTIREAVKMAVKAINTALKRDSCSGNGIDVIVVKNNEIKRVMNKELDYNL